MPFKKLDEARLLLFSRHLQRIKFYLKLQEFGYKLYLKPVKIYHQEYGRTERKANCDVEMAFYLMKEKDSFGRVIVLSGDGDFYCLHEYLEKNKKLFKIIIPNRKSESSLLKQFQGYKVFLIRDKDKVERK